MKASRLRRGWLLALIVGAMVGSATAADPPRRAKRPPQLWAIIIGIENYSDPAIPDSQTAADHAQSLVQWFRAAGWDESPPAPVPGLRQRRPGQAARLPPPASMPTQEEPEVGRGRVAPPPGRGGRPRRHLFRRPGRDRRDLDAGPQSEPKVDHYLLPIDARKTDVKGTGWSLDEVVDRCALRRIRVVCWLATGVGPTATRPRSAGQPAGGRARGVRMAASD